MVNNHGGKSPRPGGTDLPGGAICSMDHLFTKFFFLGGGKSSKKQIYGNFQGFFL